MAEACVQPLRGEPQQALTQHAGDVEQSRAILWALREEGQKRCEWLLQQMLFIEHEARMQAPEIGGGRMQCSGVAPIMDGMLCRLRTGERERRARGRGEE